MRGIPLFCRSLLLVAATAALSWAQTALKYLEDGVKNCPENDLGRLYLAEALHDAGKTEQAREQLEAIFHHAPAPDPRFAPEYPYIRSRAEELSKELE
ncbi:MAG: tetratricopeptide repeat protein [bacterium]